MVEEQLSNGPTLRGGIYHQGHPWRMVMPWTGGMRRTIGTALAAKRLHVAHGGARTHVGRPLRKLHSDK